MTSKILSKRFIYFVVIAGVMYLILVIFYLHRTQKKQYTAETPLSQDILKLPVNLKIPAINLDASVESVGITFDGAMGVPVNPADAAWYNLGPRPGQVGNAIIMGHYGLKNSIPAIFDNLHKLQKGDIVSIVDEKGVAVNFIVREIKIYSDADNTDEIFKTGDSGAHLVLITCQGVWDRAKKSYSERLVVFTDLLK